MKEETQIKKNEETIIRVADMDHNFKRKLRAAPGAEKIRACFQCGTCIADCPISLFDKSYRPAKIIWMALLGMKKEVLSSNALWLCAACYACTDRCPRGVEPASVIRVLKNLAVTEGFIPVAHREMAANILATGYAYKIPRSRLMRRGKLGLPPLPKGAVESVTKICEGTGLSKLIEKKGD